MGALTRYISLAASVAMGCKMMGWLIDERKGEGIRSGRAQYNQSIHKINNNEGPLQGSFLGLCLCKQVLYTSKQASTWVAELRGLNPVARVRPMF